MDNDSRAAPDRPPDSLPFDVGEMPPLAPKWSAPSAEAPIAEIWKKLAGVKITCTGSACDLGLHCFRLTKKIASILGPGSCRECHKPLISMRRVARRNLDDVDYTFTALQLEFIRHYFWHVPFGQKAMNYAHNAGRRDLDARIPNRIRKRVGGAVLPYDGRQTPISPYKADTLDMAAHAVAACCRKCIEYWHGIPRGQALTEPEVEYLAELMRRFLHARLPNLDELPFRELRRRPDAEVHSLPEARERRGKRGNGSRLRHRAS